MKFLALRVRAHTTFHGYDELNRERVEQAPPSEFAEKLIALDRVLSATEQFILVAGPFGRQYYWEYEGGLAALRARLTSAGLVLG